MCGGGDLSCFVCRLRTFAYLPAFNFWLLLAPICLNYDWQMGSIPLVDKWTDARTAPALAFYTGLLWVIAYTVYKVSQLFYNHKSSDHFHLIRRLIFNMVTTWLWVVWIGLRRKVRGTSESEVHTYIRTCVWGSQAVCILYDYHDYDYDVGFCFLCSRVGGFVRGERWVVITLMITYNPIFYRVSLNTWEMSGGS